MPDSSPSLPSIQVEGYRAFYDRQQLELRSLTLLYGRNQAGKSTMLRLLPLLADSIFGRVPALDLSSAALQGSTFKELGWLGPGPSTSPTLRVGASKGPYLELQLTYDDGVVPNRVRVGSGDSPQFDVSWSGGKNRAGQTFQADYRGTYAGSAWEGRLKFESLLPRGLPEYAAKDLDRIRSSLAGFERLQWLATSRSQTVGSPRATRCCGPDAADLPELLSDRQQLLRQVSIWLEQRDELGESVSIVKDSAGRFELRLRRPNGESLPLHLAGEGLRWLLPILLCSYWALAKGPDSPTMLVIEEPEARLHPSLQAPLFDLLLKLSRQGIPVVLETHSVYMLRSLQLALAKRELRPEDTALYWMARDVKSQAATARRVLVRDDGTLEGWEADSFEEEQKLSRKLFNARWKSKGTG